MAPYPANLAAFLLLEQLALVLVKRIAGILVGKEWSCGFTADHDCWSESESGVGESGVGVSVGVEWEWEWSGVGWREQDDDFVVPDCT